MYGGQTLGCVLAGAIALGTWTVPASAASYPLDPADFPVSSVLEENVDFWISIYSRYTTQQAVLHDERYPDLVYEVVELGDLDRPGISESRLRKARADRLDEAKDRLEGALARVARGAPRGAEEERIAALFDDRPHGRDRLAGAISRLRAQIGLKDRFEEAVRASGRYLPGIERIFAAEGLPTALSRLPFVESMFTHVARSKVGAVGAWQFMPGTARLYMEMSSAVDARYDTFLAAEGAARMLRHDHEELGTWPLAITAYNHGRAGIARAVQRLGTRDLGEIVTRYDARRFGFASRNFYAEFVAAATVYDQRARHFPGVAPDDELRFDEYELPRFVSLLDLAEGTGTELALLRDLNPALNDDVFAGTLLVPRAYRLRVPPGSATSFAEAYRSLPPERVRMAQLQVGYRVVRGDTVGAIARRFGTTIGAIQRANNLSRPDRIYIGQYLRIPGQSFGGEPSATTAALAADGGTHVVRRGESLSQIARRYRRTVGELAATNGLSSPDTIYPGQSLRIPALGVADSGSGVHVVQPGDSLTRIARTYGVTVDALREENELRSTVIRPGQVLRIP